MRDGILNCPNCGAPVTGGRCEYCGTLFLDFGALSMDEPTYIRIRREEGFAFFRCIVRNIEMECRPTPTVYAWNDPRIVVQEPLQYILRFEAVSVPNEKGLVFIESKSPALDPYAQELAGLEENP